MIHLTMGEAVFMCDSLVERLRILGNGGVGIYAATMKQAASRIVELEKQVREQEIQLQVWRDEWHARVNGER